MKERRTGTAVVTMRLTPMMAEKRIRDAAQVSENVIFGERALENMDEHGITDIQVLEMLLSGFVSMQPIQTQYGDWQCKITKEFRGRREAGAVVVILHNGRLFVFTVEWEETDDL